MRARRIPGNDGRLTPTKPPSKTQSKPAKKRGKILDSYTKIIVLIILVNAIAWVWCSYILAYLGRYEIAEALSQTAITTILGTIISYCTKSVIENVNKHGINLKPSTTTTTTTTTTDGAIIIGVNANLEE